MTSALRSTQAQCLPFAPGRRCCDGLGPSQKRCAGVLYQLRGQLRGGAKGDDHVAPHSAGELLGLAVRGGAGAGACGHVVTEREFEKLLRIQSSIK